MDNLQPSYAHLGGRSVLCHSDQASQQKCKTLYSVSDTALPATCRRHTIATSIAFTSNIDLEVLDIEQSLEVLEELDEVIRNILLVSGTNFASGKSCTDWRFHPDWMSL